jgi:hypothetical protein
MFKLTPEGCVWLGLSAIAVGAAIRQGVVESPIAGLGVYAGSVLALVVALQVRRIGTTGSRPILTMRCRSQSRTKRPGRVLTMKVNAPTSLVCMAVLADAPGRYDEPQKDRPVARE